MDKERFDELVRRLAEERNRRSVVSGIGGALVASVGLAGAAEDGGASGKKSNDKGKAKDRSKASDRPAAKGRDKDGKKGGKGRDRDRDKDRDRNPDDYDQPRQPGIEGPCGDGTRNDNICMKNGECCTGICEITLRKTNKDKRGRCRCLRMGATCAADRNCCNSLCIGGICGSLS
ncbi:MAG: hypothetical protein ACKOWF_01085 [Chloroflexota bacterium]